MQSESNLDTVYGHVNWDMCDFDIVQDWTRITRVICTCFSKYKIIYFHLVSTLKASVFTNNTNCIKWQNVNQDRCLG